MEALAGAGALATCWSGAGPTILGISLRGRAEDVRAAGEAALASLGLTGRAIVLSAAEGLTTGQAGRRPR